MDFSRLFKASSEHRGAPSRKATPFSITGEDSHSSITLLGGGNRAYSGETVTEEIAMGVPAIAAAVNVVAGTIASLPLQLFRRTKEGREVASSDPIHRMVHDVVNPSGLTSSAWLNYVVHRLLLVGRAFTYIERGANNKATALWPLDPSRVRTEPEGRWGVKYIYNDPVQGEQTYSSADIIDVIWQPGATLRSHRNPINAHRHTIGLIIAAERYASTVFENAGVPPFIMEAPAMSGQAMAAASDDAEAAIQRAMDLKKRVLVAPTGSKFTQIGFEAAKNQLLELRAFQILEVSRIWNVQPTFLHDLSNGTYSNAEQMDLAFTKHTIRPLTERIEQEANAKLFADRNRANFIEFNLDALLRGDSSRIANYASGVAAGIYMPDEIRGWENLPPVAGGDRAYRQGALVPLDSPAPQSKAEEPKPAPTIEAQAEAK